MIPQNDIRADGAPPTFNVLDQIDLIVSQAREGRRTETAALRAIGQLVRRHVSPVDTYQKPWG